MNNRSFLIAFLLVFVFIFAYEWLFHGVLLSPIYQDTAELWRPEEEMLKYFHWMLVGQFCLAAFFCLVFQKMYRNGGVKEAIGIGLLLGLLMSSPELIMYAVTPYPIKLVAIWVLGGCIEFVLAAIVIALIYKPENATD